MLFDQVESDILLEIHASEIFKSLSNDQFIFLTKNMKYRTATKKQIIFEQRDTAWRLFFVISGLVQATRIDEDGQEYVNLISAHKLFPLYRLLDKNFYFNYTVEAITNISFVTFQRKDFEQLLRQNNEFALGILKHVSESMNRYEKQLSISLETNASERIRKTISWLFCELGRSNGPENEFIVIPYKIPIFLIAKLSGTTRETASRFINGYINHNHDGVIVTHFHFEKKM
ncbi:Crp/Fnr family transcriptional regulator [Oenococcus oeni]|nr:Crp/Fnr family transcriptional regulator [Oenococcus oeni]